MKEKLCRCWARLRANEYLYLTLAFLIPIVIMYVIYIFMTVWPFGKYSCMVLDLNGQYVYYFEKLRDVLTKGGSLLYAWERSLGGEFMGIFALTQVPLAIIEGIVTVVVVMGLDHYAQPELRDLARRRCEEGAK